MDGMSSPQRKAVAKAAVKPASYALPGLKKKKKNTGEKTSERSPFKSPPRKNTNRMSVFGSFGKNRKNAGATTVVSNVFVDTTELESKIEKEEKKKHNEVEIAELPEKLNPTELMLLSFPFVGLVICTFGILKDLVLIPETASGKCYVNLKAFLPRSSFNSEAEYCSQQQRALFFLIPVGLQFLIVLLYFLLRLKKVIATTFGAKIFHIFLAISHVIMFECTGLIVGLFHFNEGLQLIWLIGYTYRMGFLTLREKICTIIFVNILHGIFLTTSKLMDTNITTNGSLVRTIVFPLFISLLLVVVNYQSDQGEKEHDRQTEILQRKYKVLEAQVTTTEKLLQCVLPKEIISTVKELAQTKGKKYCVSYNEVTVLFAKICGIHEMFEELPTVEVVGQLDALFKLIDNLTDVNSIEKIKTVGDTYMCASGLPTPNPDHAYNMVKFAFTMSEKVCQFNDKLDFKIGMCIGKIVAGVIGETKFTYDIWGDAANTASRMYSHGVKHKIQCPKETADQIKDRFEVSLRGVINVKGKGDMEVYFIVKALEGVDIEGSKINSTSIDDYRKMQMNVENIQQNNKSSSRRQSIGQNKLAALLFNGGGEALIGAMAQKKGHSELAVEKKEWVSDSLKTCQQCHDPFSLTNRRHHCRYCGMLLCGNCSKWKIDKKRACANCVELFEEAIDRNEFLRKRAEEEKKDKEARAKKNLVSAKPWTACLECVRSGTSRKLERNFLAKKKRDIFTSLVSYWMIILVASMWIEKFVHETLNGSCVDTGGEDVKSDGMYTSNRSPCGYDNGAGIISFTEVPMNALDTIAKREDVNEGVKVLVKLLVGGNNTKDVTINAVDLVGNKLTEMTPSLLYSWTTNEALRPWPGMTENLIFAHHLNLGIVIPLTVLWVVLSLKLDYETLWDTSVQPKAKCFCGGSCLNLYNDLLKIWVIHSDHIVVAFIATVIIGTLLFEMLYCHYYFGMILMIYLYALNTYAVMEHGIVFMLTIICMIAVVIYTTVLYTGTTSTPRLELREQTQFFFFFLVCVYPVVVQGKQVDMNMRQSFLNTEVLKTLKDVSNQERDKNIAMLPLPSVISEGLQKGKNVVIDAYGTVLFADIVSFTVFSSSDALAPIPSDRPKNLVKILNDMFSMHDALAVRAGVDKVKTLGDCYVAACGLLVPTANHAALLTKFGIGMHGVMRTLNDNFNLRGKGPKGKDLRIRVGLASGTVVGGVVGGKKFIFDLWGQTVEDAELMESEGIPEKVHISHATYLRARKDRDLEFTKRDDRPDLVDMGYSDPSYVATPKAKRFNRVEMINDWINEIFPKATEAKMLVDDVDFGITVEEHKRREQRASMVAIDGDDILFEENPLSRRSPTTIGGRSTSRGTKLVR